MSTDALNGEVIWVTGASSGIGRELALQLAARGNRVLITGRNQQALQELAEGSVGDLVPVPGDIAAADAAESLQAKLEAASPWLDRIILNAGTCEYFDVKQPDWGMLRRIMEVNFFGSINCLQAALPLLEQHRIGRGHVVAIGSQASRAAFPRSQAYGASKAALSYFMQCMAVDMQQRGIDVTVVQPGFVDTPLTRKNDFPMPFVMSVEKAAKIILNKVAKRPLLVQFPTRLNAVLALAELAPQFWCRRIVARRSRA
ncbi:MAG: SDR family NAD(P)-dependent oxidoreductase [Gammaproteobacteria bacterium]|uniref:SDR family NAD(P)-dependent oxidoreductase n=1 Tax=Pseudomaricurvus alcaniphilus TaxID=1166482 RepID=UPI001408AB1E|nr:SDR family NAD(P)-dependent oxidoreductase [Pseudomaricurvus alcaniphilus]MBR9913080.1 SDR family NAD(P)-dependent oxidoreductase [Gammaproteobacteria bacterium]NHN36098.1 SDR family NAD(P)-dependent oxidoreductase [Pseudomaricurvus alcaniphilus]